jgi:gamma-glutamyltranspeptidase/glutathione hydrolase
MAVSKALMFVSLTPKCLRAMVISIALALSFSVASLSFAAEAAPDRSAVGTHGMVVSESEQAAGAGLEILKHGGNAVDAAAATALRHVHAIRQA